MRSDKELSPFYLDCWCCQKRWLLAEPDLGRNVSMLSKFMANLFLFLLLLLQQQQQQHQLRWCWWRMMHGCVAPVISVELTDELGDDASAKSVIRSTDQSPTVIRRRLDVQWSRCLVVSRLTMLSCGQWSVRWPVAHCDHRRGLNVQWSRGLVVSPLTMLSRGQWSIRWPVAHCHSLSRRGRFPATNHYRRLRPAWRHRALPVPFSRQRDRKSGSASDRLPQWEVDERLATDARRQRTKCSMFGQRTGTGFIQQRRSVQRTMWVRAFAHVRYNEINQAKATIKDLLQVNEKFFVVYWLV